MSRLTAPDGKNGLAFLQSSLHPDLVISDITMPRMGGIELFKIIQQDGGRPTFPGGL
jgi:YesN/AraC family two-component response regulator